MRKSFVWGIRQQPPAHRRFTFLLFLKVIDRVLESGDGWKCGGDFLTDQAGDFAIIANACDVAVTRPSGRAGLE